MPGTRASGGSADIREPASASTAEEAKCAYVRQDPNGDFRREAAGLDPDAMKRLITAIVEGDKSAPYNAICKALKEN